MRKEIGLAGYHFTVPRATTVLRVRGTVRVPSAACGKRAVRYGLQIGAGFTSGMLHEDAIVLLLLECGPGRAGNGTVQLVTGYQVKMPARPVIRAGQVLRIRVTVRPGAATARIVFPDGRSDSVSGPGGVPGGVDYALTLPRSRPPDYSVVTFTRCTVNGRDLAAFRPQIWSSVTRSGRVDGRVSDLAGGTGFTISH